MNTTSEKTPLLIKESKSTKNSKIVVIEKKSEGKGKKPPRLLSLDILRGLTVFLMIVVNQQPGSEKFWALNHADFNGITPTDFIFPFFLLIMGYAMGIVFSRKKPSGEYGEKVEKQKILWCFKVKMKNKNYFMMMKWVRIVRRSVLLYLLGLGDNFIDAVYDLRKIRILGVLPRIGICYFVISLVLNLVKSTVTQILIVFNLHLIYILVMFTIPIPNCGTGVINQKCSAEGWFDQLILGKNHIWDETYYFDPEGFVSTLSAISTTFMGCLYFKIAKQLKKKYKKDYNFHLIAVWTLFGVTLIIISMILNYYLFPYNKHIWSSSFVLVTAGTAGIFLSIITFIVDIHGVKFWIYLFLCVGVNPLVMYVLPDYVDAVMGIIPVNRNKTEFLSDFLYRVCLLSWIKNIKVSNMLYGLIFESLFLPLAIFLYWKKIYIKL